MIQINIYLCVCFLKFQNADYFMLILLKVMKKDLDKKGVIQYYNTLT